MADIKIAGPVKVSFPDMPLKPEEFDKERKYKTTLDVRIRPEHINGKSGYYFIDEGSFYYDYPYQWDHLYYPGLHTLNLLMYENIYSSMRMCRKLRDFLKPVAPVNDLRNSACYPMGIPERKLSWSDNVIDMIFTEDKIIAAINRKQNEYKYNINHTYGKYGR